MAGVRHARLVPMPRPGIGLLRRGMNMTGMRWLGVATTASLAIITTALAPAVAQPSVHRATGSPATLRVYHGTPGRARAGTPTASTRPTTRVYPKGTRRLTSSHYSTTQTTPRVTAAAAAAGVSRSPTVNFDGVSSRDSQFTNFKAKFEPPDQGLCEGNGFVLEPVNSAYRIYRTTGKSLRGPFNVNDLFNVGGKEFTSDPRCWFDSSTQTWFATILFINDASTAASTLIAVRHDPSPVGAVEGVLDRCHRPGREWLSLLRGPAEDGHRPDQPVHHRR